VDQKWVKNFHHLEDGSKISSPLTKVINIRFWSKISFESNSRVDYFHGIRATNASKSIKPTESQGRIAHPGLFMKDNEMVFEGRFAYMFVRVHTVYKLYHTYSKLRWKRFLLSSGCVLIYLSFQSVFSNLTWLMLLTHVLSADSAVDPEIWINLESRFLTTSWSSLGQVIITVK